MAEGTKKKELVEKLQAESKSEWKEKKKKKRMNNRELRKR